MREFPRINSNSHLSAINRYSVIGGTNPVYIKDIYKYINIYKYECVTWSYQITCSRKQLDMNRRHTISFDNAFPSGSQTSVWSRLEMYIRTGFPLDFSLWVWARSKIWSLGQWKIRFIATNNVIKAMHYRCSSFFLTNGAVVLNRTI